MDWESFVNDNLISHGMVDGVAVATAQGQCVYDHGILKDQPQDWQNLCTAFNWLGTRNEATVLNKGFNITLNRLGTLKFHIHHTTACSMYGVSENGNVGLILCNLPHAILLAVHQRIAMASKVIQIVDNFCEQLRA